MNIPRELMATEKMIKYMGVLFIDCGFSLVAKREFLRKRFRKNFTDELTIEQAGKVIEELKEMKERGKEKEEENES